MFDFTTPFWICIHNLSRFPPDPDDKNLFEVTGFCHAIAVVLDRFPRLGVFARHLPGSYEQ
jgi:hypothetical protein